MAVQPADGVEFPLSVPVVVIGAGACGTIAALSAHEAGAEVVILERDSVPAGSTSLSAGMIPAAGTKIQAAAGIDDNAELLIADVMNKNHETADLRIVSAVAHASGPTVDWLAEDIGIELTLVTGYLYPSTSRLRMHAPPSRTGADLIAALTNAVTRRGIDLLTDAQVTDIYIGSDADIRGIGLRRPDGSQELIGCTALILACNGYGGNPSMVAEYIPDMVDATYFGPPGNQGEAVIWGRSLGAATRHMTGYQGHASVAHPHGILVTWALMMGGGIQVNIEGKRFSNEHEGYSERASILLAQPGKVGFCLYDQPLHELGLDQQDYRRAHESGAIKTAETVDGLADLLQLPAGALADTVDEVRRYAAGDGVCPFGRDFTGNPPLRLPLYGVKVTGALFHTQGGLVIDEHARALGENGEPLPNLFAGGGAACGISGPEPWGYLSGNGLLTATTLGRLAGQAAAQLVAV
ncbi:MAG: FAD-dependent oxidoreductase [Alphaproteobacteria bacterium]|nr:FAD-dependent oxidoreductase [Alphaproteobacteria bacterium]